MTGAEQQIAAAKAQDANPDRGAITDAESYFFLLSEKFPAPLKSGELLELLGIDLDDFTGYVVDRETGAGVGYITGFLAAYHRVTGELPLAELFEDATI